MTDQTTNRRRKIAGESRRRPETQATDTAAPKPPQRTSDTSRTPRGSVRVASPPGAPTTRDRLARGIPTWLLVCLACLLVAAVAFDLIVAARSSNAEDQRTIRSAAITSAFNQAPAQAEAAASTILGYDHKTLRGDADAAKQDMTPAYAKKFQRTVDRLLAKPADEVKAHVEAKVKASGVVSATPSKVDVMLFLDQTSTTTADAEPQTYLNRVVFTMVKAGDRWLVDDVTAL